MTAMRLKRYPSPSGGIALGKMGVGATMLKQGKTARDYVQTGLVAMWDGIENAGWGTHDASATTWVDLSGNGYDAIAQSTPTWNNTSFCGDGSCYFLIQNGFDLCATMKNNTGGTVEIIQFYRQSTTAFQPTLNLNSRNFFSAYGGSSPDWCTPTEFTGSNVGNYTLGAISYDCVTVTPTSASFYREGLYVYEKSGSTYVSAGIFSQSSLFAIGAFWFNSSRLSAHNIKSIRIYSRVLTADEIAANYAIDKERFNLP